MRFRNRRLPGIGKKRPKGIVSSELRMRRKEEPGRRCLVFSEIVGFEVGRSGRLFTVVRVRSELRRFFGKVSDGYSVFSQGRHRLVMRFKSLYDSAKVAGFM